MNLVRLRNGKARLILGVVAGLVIVMLTYIMHDTHSRLMATRVLAQDCEHKQDSLSAQLQVSIEHRTRLEKTLQQEKLSSKQTKEKLESLYEELQEQADKEKQEAQNKYNALQQQSKAMQRQLESLQEEFSKLQQINAELLEEKQNLVNKMNTQLEQLRLTKDEEISHLQVSLVKLQQEREEMAIRFDQSHLIQNLQSELQACVEKLALTKQEPSKQSVISSPNKVVIKDSVMPKSLSKAQSVSIKENEVKGIPSQHPEGNFIGPLANKVQNQDVQRGAPQPLNSPYNVLHPPHNYVQSHQSPVIQDANEGHQLANPQDVEQKLIGDANRQLEDPNRLERSVNEIRKEQIAEPPAAVVHNVDALAPQQEQEGPVFRREAELVPNGLEQQENGEDQDLDDMDNEVMEEKKNANRFEDADFDQADQDDNDGNRNSRQPVKPEGVIVAPH